MTQARNVFPRPTFVLITFPSDLESGSDYTITVEDNDSGDSHVSDPFTIIGDPDVNIEITSPDGYVLLKLMFSRCRLMEMSM